MASVTTGRVLSGPVSSAGGVVIAYRRGDVEELLADGSWGDKVEWLSTFDFQDYRRRREGAAFVHELVSEMGVMGGMWHMPANPGVDVEVSSTWEDGEAAALTVTVSGMSMGPVRIGSLLELPVAPVPVMLDVFDVLDGVAVLLGELLTQVSVMLMPDRGGVPCSEIALKVVSVEAVRADAADDPDLSERDNAVVQSASDADIAAAIIGAWPQVEDWFFMVHDHLQIAARETVIAAKVE